MNYNQITNYVELQHYIKQQVSLQITLKKRVVEIKLQTKWFIKAAEFIKFSIKYRLDEPDKNSQVKETDDFFKCRINGYQTKFIRYDE